MDKDQLDFNKEIGMRIRRHREFLDFTREELAEKADISTQFLADIETGRKSMTVKTLKNISQSLSASTDYILTGITKDSSTSEQDKHLLLLLESMTPHDKKYATEILKLYMKALQQDQ